MKTSSQIIREYVALLEQTLTEAGCVIPYRVGQDSEFVAAKDKANSFCGYHSAVLRDISPNAEKTIAMGLIETVEKNNICHCGDPNPHKFTHDCVPF